MLCNCLNRREFHLNEFAFKAIFIFQYTYRTKHLHRSRIQTSVLILKEALETIQSHRCDSRNKNKSWKSNEKCIFSPFIIKHEMIWLNYSKNLWVGTILTDLKLVRRSSVQFSSVHLLALINKLWSKTYIFPMRVEDLHSISLKWILLRWIVRSHLKWLHRFDRIVKKPDSIFFFPGILYWEKINRNC